MVQTQALKMRICRRIRKVSHVPCATSFMLTGLASTADSLAPFLHLHHIQLNAWAALHYDFSPTVTIPPLFYSHSCVLSAPVFVGPWVGWYASARHIAACCLIQHFVAAMLLPSEGFWWTTVMCQADLVLPAQQDFVVCAEMAGPGGPTLMSSNHLGAPSILPSGQAKPRQVTDSLARMLCNVSGMSSLFCCLSHTMEQL